ncbi:TPA: hypothetical protein EYP66_02805 [Candidatus Poribacteria bacterium]|nr:hypothetical protein [Candidatus Poribacteria bacterium]
MLRKMLILSFSFIYCLALSIVVTNLSEAIPKPESIIGAWLFDEGKGDEVKDSSGKERNGKIIGNAKWISGKFGKALEFTPGNKVEIPHADDFTTSTFTLMAWINIPKATGQWHSTS